MAQVNVQLILRLVILGLLTVLLQLMFFAQVPQDCDRKQMSLCNNCRNELNKLNR